MKGGGGGEGGGCVCVLYSAIFSCHTAFNFLSQFSDNIGNIVAVPVVYQSDMGSVSNEFVTFIHSHFLRMCVIYVFFRFVCVRACLRVH